jgi:ribosomal protein S18 acetylase RimI-like enzyme
MRFESFESRYVSEIVRLCVTEGWISYADPAIALRALTAPGSIVVVAVEDRCTVVGFVQLQSDGVVHAHVSNILVAASHRQCRVGHQLLEQAFARSGAQYLDLVSTEGADAFYRSFDHKEFRGFRLYPKPGETVR